MGDIPARLLTDECPRYRVEIRPRPLAAPVDPAPARKPGPADLLTLLASPGVASRAWIYEQYDQLVQSRTVRRPGLDAAVLRLRPSFRGIAVSLDGAGRLASLDPRAGGALADPRGGAQRRVRRRQTARRHRLPQLRQPREAGDRLGARRGYRGHGARLRSARSAGRLRQRLALQRDRRPRDPSDAGRRLRRARRRRAAPAGDVA